MTLSKNKILIFLFLLFVGTTGCITNAVMRFADEQMTKSLQPDEILTTTLTSGSLIYTVTVNKIYLP